MRLFLTRIRSLLFMLWLYGSMAFFGLVFSPLLLLPSSSPFNTVP